MLAQALLDRDDALAAAEQEIARLRALVPQIVEALCGFSRFDRGEIVEHPDVAPLLADAARDGRQP
jgi:hypothetical protein